MTDQSLTCSAMPVPRMVVTDATGTTHERLLTNPQRCYERLTEAHIDVLVDELDNDELGPILGPLFATIPDDASDDSKRSAVTNIVTMAITAIAAIDHTPEDLCSHRFSSAPGTSRIYLVVTEPENQISRQHRQMALLDHMGLFDEPFTE